MAHDSPATDRAHSKPATPLRPEPAGALTAPNQAKGDFTRLLNLCAAGDQAAIATVMKSVYDELRAMAGNKLLSERADHTLRATELVHQAFIKLVNTAGTLRSIPATNRRAFFGCASRAMQQVLIDHARNRSPTCELQAQTAVRPAASSTPSDVEIALALHRLERVEPMLAELVRLQYFAGLERSEIAASMQITLNNFDYLRKQALIRLRVLMKE